jgi:hypothetical protein
LRRIALVTLMVLAALVAPVALPIRMVVLHLRREPKTTEFVVREDQTSPIRLPQRA